MNIIQGQHAGFIPCRAGSKRFPGKNKALFGGQPLFMQAIALSEFVLKRTIVSTDDDAILLRVTCEKHIRPAHLATGVGYRIDDVIIDMVNTISEVPEFIHLIQVTSPFIRAFDIEDSIEMLNYNNDFDSVQLVTKVSNNCHAFSQRRMNQGVVEFCYPAERKKYYNSQLKPPHYIFAGYVGFRTKSLLKYGNIWGKQSIGKIGPPECAIDIDTPEDLEYAEFILERRQRNAS